MLLSDSGQAGAISQNVITPAMVSAGAEVLALELWAGGGLVDSKPELVAEIYQAMSLARDQNSSREDQSGR